MPSLTCFHYRFTPSWFMIFFTTLVFSLLIKLGVWQLDRAEEKQKMLQASANQLENKPLNLDDWLKTKHSSSNLIQYQRVETQGSYVNYIFLLDNQHRQHQFGFNVLTPLLLRNGNIILVDRGWIPGDNSRRSYPEVKTTKKNLILQGTVYFPSKNRWLLGPNSEKIKASTTLLESIDFKLASQILQKTVYPFIIRLDKNQPNGFVRDWPIVSMPPQKHFAYALQWFAMALVVLVLFIALNIKKYDENNAI